MRKILLLLLIPSTIFLSCKKEILKENTLQFRVNKALLNNEEINDNILNLSYRIPVGFNAVKLNNTLSLKEINLDSISSLPLENRSFYFDKKHFSFLIISLVKNGIKKEKAIESLKKHSNRKTLWKEYNFTTFTNNQIAFYQFILQSNDYVIFKLLVSQHKNLSEINYIIPKRFYTNEVAKKLESSIGSIKKNNY